jgi:TP901-1 family phage major tail protein
MATTGIVNGKYLRFYDDGQVLAFATSCSLSFSMSPREIAHKDTPGTGGGWREVLPGQKSGTGSTEGLYAEDNNAFATLYDKFIAGTPCDLTFTTGESGDDTYYGQAYITSMELTAPNDESSTWSISFEFNGEVVRS